MNKRYAAATFLRLNIYPYNMGKTVLLWYASGVVAVQVMVVVLLLRGTLEVRLKPRKRPYVVVDEEREI